MSYVTVTIICNRKFWDGTGETEKKGNIVSFIALLKIDFFKYGD